MKRDGKQGSSKTLVALVGALIACILIFIDMISKDWAATAAGGHNDVCVI